MIWLILSLLMVQGIGVGLAVTGSIDVVSQPSEVWAATGHRRAVWVWQAAAVFAFPLALVYSGIYFGRIRADLMRARALDDADAEWTQRPRWYDRVNTARRSPARWAQAARLWWTWLIPVAVFSAGLIAQLMLFTRQGANRVPVGYLVLDGSASAVAVISAAARAGFWYAERMRLTGRRPARGGRLLPRTPPAAHDWTAPTPGIEPGR